MNYILFQKKDGRIIGQGSAAEGHDLSPLEDEHTGALAVEDLSVIGQKVVDGALVPTQDSDFSEDLIAEAWFRLRVERHARLAACDWTQVPDAPVDRAAWAAYRQQLRDLPANTADPRNVIWPEPPQ